MNRVLIITLIALSAILVAGLASAQRLSESDCAFLAKYAKEEAQRRDKRSSLEATKPILNNMAIDMRLDAQEFALFDGVRVLVHQRPWTPNETFQNIFGACFYNQRLK